MSTAGGAVTTAITDDDGGFVAQVVWRAPALNTLMSRHTEDEIVHVLNFGRNGVMPAWGGGGGGPLTDQQIEEVIFYLRSIQIEEETIRSEVEGGVLQAVREWIVEEDERFTDDYLVAIREAEAAQLDALLAVEGPDVQCDHDDLEADERALCDTLDDANGAVSEARSAGGDQLEAAAIEWVADAKGIANVAEGLALLDDPSLSDPVNLNADGENLALRWAALDLLSDPDAVPNVEDYWQYGEFLFANPASQGTYSCARCHTFGWSYDAAERFTVRANGTTESILPDGYDQDRSRVSRPATSSRRRAPMRPSSKSVRSSGRPMAGAVPAATARCPDSARTRKPTLSDRASPAMPSSTIPPCSPLIRSTPSWRSRGTSDADDRSHRRSRLGP